MEMSSLVQLRPKRQLTVPTEVADKLNLQTGDYLEATADGDKLVFVVKEVRDRSEKKYSLRELVGTANGIFGKTSEEIDKHVKDLRSEWK